MPHHIAWLRKAAPSAYEMTLQALLTVDVTWLMARSQGDTFPIKVAPCTVLARQPMFGTAGRRDQTI
eukprot:CAMPEP_0174330250 /NCGR_PEP_ID=MMETSP0810-20121108/16512_1 /TAXON_ID=73025 ORGANISM="Eutreptiella gymnastica-like, Strain CCMP1594" /NCGR_SAMPLE_ID=MMETSP0810 /ASSEMBLY_ACC=CAM_ASM_000659 /LENGTH=66 /DNA_ID=CAMNT_0015445275 /DNA_START=129 /DNA_END=330 /DNA_ORIENTATION=+